MDFEGWLLNQELIYDLPQNKWRGTKITDAIG